jgi:hypothetical protein
VSLPPSLALLLLAQDLVDLGLAALERGLAALVDAADGAVADLAADQPEVDAGGAP